MALARLNRGASLSDAAIDGSFRLADLPNDYISRDDLVFFGIYLINATSSVV
jgi:hypothetical protein